MAGDDRDPLDPGRPELVQQRDDDRASVDRQYRLRVALGQRPEAPALACSHHHGFHAA
jgi:hypothetical protein